MIDILSAWRGADTRRMSRNALFPTCSLCSQSLRRLWLRESPKQAYTAEVKRICQENWSKRMVQLSIKDVEARLGEVKCAICKGNRFGIDSRTVTTGDGDWKAICLDCHYIFPVYTDMEFYLQTQPDIPYILKEIACKSCRHRGVSLDFRAVLSVRESVYFVTCASCQLKFPEQSFLESFE